jgi:diguanylate cyclase (GGDEF)-like protein
VGKKANEWTKIDTMKKLADLISANDAGEMFEHIHTMVALIERDGALVSWNRAFESYKAKWPLAGNLQDCFSEKEKVKIQNMLNTDQRDWFEVEFGTNAEEKTIFCKCLLIPLADSRAFFIAEQLDTDTSLPEIIQRLNTQVKKIQAESKSAQKIAHDKQTEIEGILAQADELSHVDALTFLPNRRMIVRELQDEVLRAERYKTQFSVSVLDVDFFKNVNDTYGHLVGDEVLRHVGYQLRDHIRHPDIAGRYGGEEFLILLPNTKSTEAAEQAERLCKYVRETKVNVKGHIISVTISIGVAQFRPGVDTWDTLLNRADNAMYDAKRKGRDCWVVAE